MTTRVRTAGSRRAAFGCLVIAALLVVCCADGLEGGQRAAKPDRYAATKGAPVPGKPDAVPNELLVRFKPGRSLAAMTAIEARGNLRVVSSRKLSSIDWHVIKAAPGRSVKELVEEYRNSPDVVYAEPNYYRHAQQGQRLPNDTYFGQLWGMHNTGQTGGTADADVDAPEAWDTRTSSNIIVAVCDTGVDYNHPDLAANIWTNPGETPGNGVDDDGNGYIDDIRGWDCGSNDNNPIDPNGHGTHCAGTVGAVGDNGRGVVGVCWNVKIMVVKIADEQGSSADSMSMEGWAYAARMGAKVISYSFGGPGYSQATKEAIQGLERAGVLFVTAAGNEGNDLAVTPAYPASYDNPNIITVAATDHNDQLADFSNYGVISADLAAPGVAIGSTVPNGGYEYKDGTSMSCPHVSGTAALIWAAAPGESWAEIKAAILNGVEVLPSLQDKCVTAGRLNVKKALDLVGGGTRSILVGAPNGGEGFEAGMSVEVKWTASGGGWQAGDKVKLEYSSNGGGAWNAILGAGSLNYNAGTFNWSTTGLPAGTQYRVRASYVGDPGVNDSSDADFSVTGAMDHFGFTMATPQADGRAVQGTCTVVAKDAGGRTITSFGTALTAGRFPVSVTATGVTIGGLGGGNALSAANFPSGVANLTGLGMTVDVASPPKTVKFVATSANGKTGQSGNVVIQAPADYFTEHFDTSPFDLGNRAVIFIPDGSPSHYAAYTRTITALPTNPSGGTALALSDDDFATVNVPGNTVALYGTNYGTLYVGSNGYITFGAGDGKPYETLDGHFAMARISALFDDLDPASGGQVSWKALADRVAVTYSGVPEYGTTNSNTLQIELFFNGRIVLSYLGVASTDGIAGLSRGTGLPAAFLESDLSAYPHLAERQVSLTAPDGGEAFEAGMSVEVTWTTSGSNWQAGDKVRLQYSSNGGAAWTAIAGAQSLNYNAGSFTWVTTGLPAGNQYRVRVAFVGDPSINDASNANFAITGAFHHFDVVIASLQTSGRPVSGMCRVTAKDASGATITTFGTSQTAGRFPVVLTAPRVAVSGLAGGGNQLRAEDFVGGIADLTALSTVLTADSPPKNVQFTAISATGEAGTSGNVTVRTAADYFTESFDEAPLDLANMSVIFVPDGSANSYCAYTQLITELPTDPTGGTILALGDDDFAFVAVAGETVSLYGANYGSFYVGSNGYVTFGSGDDEYVETMTAHFDLPRISALFDDLSPQDGGQVSWKQLPDRVAVTFQNVPEYGSTNSNTFQIELYFNGRIVLSYLGLDCVDGLAGLSRGQGRPADFVESDLSAYPPLPGGPRLLHYFPLDTDPGWTCQGGWAFGQPTGGGSHSGDPTSAYTGHNVYGYNLNGDYPNKMVTTQYLTTSAIDCTGSMDVVLRFRRWLGVEDGQYDSASVQVSNDGTTWTTVWGNPEDMPISESDWSLHTYDISAVADDQATVYIRWGMGRTDGSVTYPGWNVDDIEIRGRPLPQRLHYFPLDTDPGWTCQGGWAFGQPTGGGSYNADPTSAYTGPNVYGYNLNGDYPSDMAATECLTTSAIDCSGATGVVLRFRRWLGVEDGQYDSASLQASNDGTNWTTVWDNPDEEAVSENQWSLQTYDISAVADNQATVYIRWGMGPTDDSVTYPGWNIDDIEIRGQLPGAQTTVAVISSPAGLQVTINAHTGTTPQSDQGDPGDPLNIPAPTTTQCHPTTGVDYTFRRFKDAYGSQVVPPTQFPAADATYTALFEAPGDPIVHVDDSNTTGQEDGSEQHPFNTIQEGIGAVSHGGAIKVARGTYPESLTIGRKRVTIAGGYKGGTDYANTPGDFAEANRDPDPRTNSTVVDGGGAAIAVQCLDMGAKGSVLTSLKLRDGGGRFYRGLVLKRVISTSSE